MSDIQYLERTERPRLAYRYTPPSESARSRGLPTLIFFPGYLSDMEGGKATALFAQCQANGQGCLLFDYSGCGLSEGRFAEQTLTEWRDDTLALIDHLLSGAVVLVGSSMGGWLMLCVALALEEKRKQQANHEQPNHEQAEQARLAGLIGIAAAPDFTDWGVDAADRALIMTEGQIVRDIESFDQPYIMTRGFIESGEANRMLGAAIALECPVRLLHGQRDEAVPFDISLRLAEALDSADVQVTFIKDGDHRLSRDADIALLLNTAERLSLAIADMES